MNTGKKEHKQSFMGCYLREPVLKMNVSSDLASFAFFVNGNFLSIFRMILETFVLYRLLMSKIEKVVSRPGYSVSRSNNSD